MTPKQKRFCQEYIVDLNGTQAAIRAGYSERTANRIASENLTKPVIQAAIQERQKEIALNLGVTQERIVKEYAKIAFSDMGEFSNWGSDGVSLKSSLDLTKDQTAAVQEVTETTSKDGGGSIKIKLHDKKGALDSLARHIGMFVDKSEVTMKGDLLDRLTRAKKRTENENATSREN